jgi:hypothetical protein
MTEQNIQFYSSKPEPVHFERQCGDCNKCCKWLYYTINGHVKHPGKPCFYLGDVCTVHEIRPQSCRDYHCAYIQGILPEWMKPSRSDVLVNVEKWGPNKEFQMLRVIECGKKLEAEVLSWLVQYSRNTGTGIIYQLSGVWNYFGPDQFMEFFKDQIIKSEFENPFIKQPQVLNTPVTGAY